MAELLTLVVTGVTSLQGAVTLGSTLAVAGDVTITGALSVGGHTLGSAAFKDTSFFDAAGAAAAVATAASAAIAALNKSSVGLGNVDNTSDSSKNSAAVTLTNKTLGSATTITAATMTLGSDAAGDIYYRNSGGALTRLAVSDNGKVLTLVGGLPTWAAPTSAGASFSPLTTNFPEDPYTLVLGDSGKLVGGNGLTAIVIPTHAVVPFPVGTVIFVTTGDDNTTIYIENTGSSPTLIYADANALQITQGQLGILTCIATDVWMVSVTVGQHLAFSSLLSISGISPIADGSYTLSSSLGGFITFQQGICVGFSPAS